MSGCVGCASFVRWRDRELEEDKKEEEKEVERLWTQFIVNAHEYVCDISNHASFV